MATFNEFTSTYYDNKNDGFEILFNQYTANGVNTIWQPALNKACTANIYKAYYHYNLKRGYHIFLEERTLQKHQSRILALQDPSINYMVPLTRYFVTCIPSCKDTDKANLFIIDFLNIFQ